MQLFAIKDAYSFTQYGRLMFTQLPLLARVGSYRYRWAKELPGASGMESSAVKQLQTE
jgi:hypothetical protein